MARRRADDILEEQRAVLELLRSIPGGLSRLDLIRVYAQQASRQISYQKLGRRLAELERQGLVHQSGDYRAIYRAAPPHSSGPDSKPEIPLSSDAMQLVTRIRLPRAQRTPVSYRAEFLDDYTPGTTWYLPAQLREELRMLGTTAAAGQPAGTYARDIMQRLIIDLSWGSSRLEGNRYSRIDTEDLLRGGEGAPGASDVDRQMILNHKAAIEFLVENAQDVGFDRTTVITVHALLSENLLSDPDSEGRLRIRAVGIGTSVYTPTAIPQVIEERFGEILRKAEAIPDALEQSFFMMVHLPYLQPFLDVNKRTSRLAANISLIKANLCPLSFVDVPERLYTDGTLAVYELNDVALLRDVFAWAYRRSCEQFTALREAMGTPDPIRLNYRQQLRRIVTDVVHARVWPDAAELERRAEEYDIPDSDRARVGVAARHDLLALRDETLRRYQITPGELDAWIHAIGDARERTLRQPPSRVLG